MLDIQLLEKFIGQLVDKLLPAVSVNLTRDAEFAKPFIENVLGHSFCLLVLDGRDNGVLHESVCDAQDVFVLAAGSKHWAKKVSMYLNIWPFRIG